MTTYAEHTKTGKRRGAPSAPLPAFEPVVSRTMMLMYDASTSYTTPGNLYTPDGGVTYPKLDFASRFPRIVIHQNNYQTVSAAETLVDYVVGKNPDIEVYVYRNIAEVTPSVLLFEGMTVEDKILTTYGDGKDWRLRTAAGASGSVVSWYPPTNNYTDAVAADGSGRKYNQYIADYYDFVQGLGTFQSKIAGWFCDCTQFWPISWHTGETSFDWLHDGVNRTRTSDPAVYAVRDGQAAFLNRAKAHRPGYKFIGNAETEFNTNSVASKFFTSPMLDLLDGGMFEYMLDRNRTNSSYLPRFGWPVTFGRFVELCGYMKSDTETICHGTAYPGGTLTDWKSGRLTICTTLLSNAIGYYDTEDASNKVYLDEYDQLLGAPIDPVPTAATTGNIWTRRYQNGIVVLNAAQTPTGSPNPWVPGPSETYSPPAGIYRKFLGAQAPTINDGQVVGVGGITIDGWDGRVLMCVTPGVHA